MFPLADIEVLLRGIAEQKEVLGELALVSEDNELQYSFNGREIRLHLMKASAAYMRRRALQLLRFRREGKLLAHHFATHDWNFTVIGQGELLAFTKNPGGGVKVRLHVFRALMALLFGIQSGPDENRI